MALDCQLNQLVDQFTVAESSGLPELGVHADGSKSRKRVDLVYINLVGVLFKKEVHTRQTRALRNQECSDRQMRSGRATASL